MNKQTTIFTVIVITMTISIWPASEAQSAPLSRKEAKQVRAIVNQEIAKFFGALATFGPSGPQGPTGPQGPQGPDGPQGPAGGQDVPRFLFATVFTDGSVNEDEALGITNANVRMEEGENITRYCFSGLPPVSGGQVSLLGGGRSAIRIIDLFIIPQGGGGGPCSVLVQTSGIGGCAPESDASCGDTSLKLLPEDQAFYILLYRTVE